MSNVVSISEARSAQPQDFIEKAYDALAALPNFRVRKGQKQLSMWVKQALLEKIPVAAEAPTGTGKTVAYLVGALAAAKESEARGVPMPIVITTATVGLQGQVVTGDLPRLIAAGLIDEGDAVIAKGRSRYFCIQSAERFVGETDGKSQFDFFNAEANTDLVSVDDIKDVLEQFHGQAWNGDVDSFKGGQPVFWAQVAASSDTCTGRQCEYYETCPYFADRRKLANAKIAIANHNLVLADLSQALEEKEAVFPYTRYFLIFDEGHHLPDKAMEIGTAKLDFSEAEPVLQQLQPFVNSIFKHGDLARFLDAKDVGINDFKVGPALALLRETRAAVAALDVEPTTLQRRFRGGVVPDNIHQPARLAYQELNLLKELVTRTLSALKNCNLADKKPELKPVLADILFNGSGLSSKFKEFTKALSLFCADVSDIRTVRWAYVSETIVSLHVSPVEGSDVLRRVVWDNPRASAALVSATLKDFGGFDRFRERAGLPENARTEALDPIFDYTQSLMVMAQMDFSPIAKERERYTTELLEKLPADIDPTVGTLVLFSSWTMMRTVVEELRRKFGDKVLSQGDMAFRDLIKEHKSRIDKGQGSVLAGVATMAEGLDLPGNYCTHVMITAIPFTVPGTPLEEERAELMGERYFRHHLMPDALVKLVQMVGRLIRTEGDTGKITLYDNRLYSKQYGRDIMKALPNFQKKREWRVKTTIAKVEALKLV
jgi:ATP-dependent DNA helicase DinG